MSVVIITLGQGAHLADCLSSLATQTYRDFQVITVVNGNSREAPATEGVELAEKTHLVFTGSNVGYGAACNVGAKAANAPILLFLNDDTVLQPECLARVHSLLSRESLCIAQPLIFHEYSSVWRGGNPCDVYGAAGIGFYAGCGTGEFYASGAALAVRTHVFDSLEGFDELLFLYHDDLDLCWRARLRGIKILSAPLAKCVHAGGQSSRSMPHATKFYYTQRNRIRVLIKNYSDQRLMVRLPVAISLILSGSLLLSVRSHSANYVRNALKAIAWNLTNLRSTLKHRALVQTTRVLADSAIEKAMSKYSMDLCVLRQHIVSNATK